MKEKIKNSKLLQSKAFKITASILLIIFFVLFWIEMYDYRFISKNCLPKDYKEYSVIEEGRYDFYCSKSKKSENNLETEIYIVYAVEHFGILSKRITTKNTYTVTNENGTKKATLISLNLEDTYYWFVVGLYDEELKKDNTLLHYGLDCSYNDTPITFEYWNYFKTTEDITSIRVSGVSYTVTNITPIDESSDSWLQYL